MSDFQRICVYCASSPGRNPAITAATVALGELLVAEGIELVYGGASVGLMGLLADTVMAGGGRVIGVIPPKLLPREVAHTGLTQLIEVETMHQRKTKMFELADGFIALPGGFGTLEELAEVLTWAQLRIHGKPIGVLDVDGYYGSLLAFVRRGVDEGLLRPVNRAMLLDAVEPAALLAAMRAYEAPSGPMRLELGDT